MPGIQVFPTQSGRQVRSPQWKNGAERFRKMALTGLMLCASVGLHPTHAQANGKIAARITSRIVDAQRTTLTGAAPFAQMAEKDQGALPDQTRLDRMILLLQPSDAQKADLQALLEAQTNPASPQFHKWLTPAEFGARFGVADADIATVSTWLQQQGFSVDEVPAGHRAIVFSGNAGQLRSAFGTELHQLQINGEQRIANKQNPSVPAALAPVISGLLSLNNSPRVATHHDRGLFQLDRNTGTVTQVTDAGTQADAPQAEDQTSNAGKMKPQFTTTTSTRTYRVVGPYDFAQIYNLKPLWNQGFDGSGQSIAIIARSDLDLNDVNKFRSNFGLGAAKVNKIYVAANPGVTADVPETALDVEWSGAVARNATINLIIGPSSLTTDGIDSAVLYAVNNNVSPVISVSYGQCELSLGADGNNFYNTAWQQAAAQGQTVFVSSGDAAATTCNQGSSYSTLGLSVNGLASTPYNVAVGGTDLYGSYSAPNTYWSPTNDPTTLQSALAYVPEIPWNDSCGNPVLLDLLRKNSGYTDTSTAQLCNNSKVTTSNYRNIVGGGGGASNCTSTTDGTIAGCAGGYKRPSWQAGPGLPNDSIRYLPDVSLFSGDGFWSSILPYCVSAQARTGVCDLTNTTNLQGGGGTSFAAPQFAGIMAIINQKTSTTQGNANPTFYKLAATQTSLNCSATGSGDPACVYHDVDTGSNAVPCYQYGGAKDCNAAISTNIWGVTTGYNAGKGYDPAIGLGSVNITNLVNAWASAIAALPGTTTTLALSPTTTTYGSTITTTVSVTAQGGTPTGNFAVLPPSGTVRPDSDPQGTLTSGTGSLKLNLLPVGTYAVTAHYAGDGNFAVSDSAAQTVTISKATPAVAIAPTRTTLSPGVNSLLTVTVAGNGSGLAPTGSITVVNTANGASLGSFALQANDAAVSSTAQVTITGSQLVAGSNNLTITYTGDANYAAASGSQTLAFTAPFALAVANSTVSINTATLPASSSTTLSVTPANGTSLAYPITLACTGTLPSGTSCALSGTVLNQPTSTSTVTLTYAPLLAMQQAPSLPGTPWRVPVAVAGVALLGLAGLRSRRVPALLAVVLALLPVAMLSGCSDGMKPSSAITLGTSSSSLALGSNVILSAVVTGTSSGQPSGSITLNDTLRGTTRNIGTITPGTGGIGSLTLSSLGLGAHSITAVYGGDSYYPGATSFPVAVNVSATATVLVSATDANGYTVTVPVGVSLQ